LPSPASSSRSSSRRAVAEPAPGSSDELASHRRRAREGRCRRVDEARRSRRGVREPDGLHEGSGRRGRDDPDASGEAARGARSARRQDQGP
jgi:hypothetical protein